MWLLANVFEKEWHNQTTLHPLGAAMVVVLGAIMLAVPRRYAVWPMIVMACFVAPAQRVVVATLDFNLLRLMVLAGWIRVLARGEAEGLTRKWVDVAMVAYVTIRAAVMVAREPSVSLFVTMMGEAFDVAGMYFLFRCLVRSADDIRSVVRGFMWVSLPVAAAFLLELGTRRNIFAVFGGVPEVTIYRDGRLRCQGAFAHPILAGCFWAALLPMMFAELWSRRGRLLPAAGLVASLFVVVACASSTPVVAALCAAVGCALYPVRRWMPAIRWSVLIALIALHLAMTAPVWHLIARVRLVGGSTAYYRYLLIDEAINHIDEWWLIGSSVGTLHWAYGLFDITNWYVILGLQGGVGFIVLFVVLLACGFRAAGRAWRAADDPAQAWLAWALGVSLFVHAVNFVGVSYFGQIIMVWYLLLAMLGAVEPVRGRAVNASGAAPAPRRRIVRLVPLEPPPPAAAPAQLPAEGVRHYPGLGPSGVA